MRRAALSLLIGLAACSGGGGHAPASTQTAAIDVHPKASTASFAGDHPRIYLPQNRDRLKAALDDKRASATRFRDIVDTQLSGRDDIYAFQSWYAALLGALTGKTSYCDYAVKRDDGIVAGEEGRIARGAVPNVAGDSYLYVGDQIGDLMLTYDWCFDRVSASQRQRWLAFAAAAVHNVWHPADATWGGTPHPWNGWGTDDPSNNYYYSFLRATMLFGLAAHDEHPDAQAALDLFRKDKIGGELVPIFARDLVGGGSREGTGYGASMRSLWELYDLWQGSTGESLADLSPHARASLLYYLHAIAPTRDLVAPIGDHTRDSAANLFDYERGYLAELARLYKDDPLAPIAKALLAGSSVPKMQQPFNYVYDFLYDLSDVPDPAKDAFARLGTAWYGPGIGEVFARSSWQRDATWLGFIAGPYTQSHAHQDQGSLLLFKEGWLVDDLIRFSHTGIRQETQMHALVRLDGLEQKLGTESKVLALHAGRDWFHVAADLAPAYGGNDKVSRDQREVVFLEPDVLVVLDRVTTDASIPQIWQLVTDARPAVTGATAQVHGGKHDLNVARVAPAKATTTVVTGTSDDDLSGGFRLEERLPGGAHVMLHVLSIDRAVKSLTPADADGRTGVTIGLADGRTATVRFGADGVDGTLERDGTTVTLGPGIDALPEWTDHATR